MADFLCTLGWNLKLMATGLGWCENAEFFFWLLRFMHSNGLLAIKILKTFIFSRHPLRNSPIPSIFFCSFLEYLEPTQENIPSLPLVEGNSSPLTSFNNGSRRHHGGNKRGFRTFPNTNGRVWNRFKGMTLGFGKLVSFRKIYIWLYKTDIFV